MYCRSSEKGAGSFIHFYDILYLLSLRFNVHILEKWPNLKLNEGAQGAPLYFVKRWVPISVSPLNFVLVSLQFAIDKVL